MKWIKETYSEFLLLPLQMKVLFVGLFFLILFSVSIVFKHKKNKVSTEQKIINIDNEIQKIDSVGVDDTLWLDSAARANGIKRKRVY